MFGGDLVLGPTSKTEKRSEYVTSPPLCDSGRRSEIEKIKMTMAVCVGGLVGPEPVYRKKKRLTIITCYQPTPPPQLDPDLTSLICLFLFVGD